MEAYTEVLADAQCHAMLIRHPLHGGLLEPLPGVDEWAPKAAQAGLQFYALVVKPETFAEATADAFYASVTSFEAEVFADLATARAWLRQRRLHRKQTGNYQFSI